jgi:geranylgeranyl diphosphate synthase, type II
VSQPTGTRSVTRFLERDRRRVDAALLAVCDRLLADMPPLITAPIRYALDAGGKRLRPILCVHAYHAAGGRHDDAVFELGCALELLHTYSLVHDDLPCMDDDALRRGRPTTHRAFGAATALLAGAALIPLAIRALDEAGRTLGLAAARRQASIGELTRAAGGGGMVGGQLLDLEAEGQPLETEAVLDLHARKTGALFCAAARIGGIAAGGDAQVVAALGRYGERLGLAFQIADDVLDETGHAEQLGKEAGRDRRHEKATVPALLGLDAARARAQHAAHAAVAALHGAGLQSSELEALARFVIDRDR